MLHPSFNFFKTKFVIKIDPQLESATQLKARGLLHMECGHHREVVADLQRHAAVHGVPCARVLRRAPAKGGE
jgi:hypothetical protein